MEVQIGEIESRVRAVDSDAMLTPETMSTIVGAVLAALEDQEEHRDRSMAERRITRGVSHEQEEQ